MSFRVSPQVSVSKETRYTRDKKPGRRRREKRKKEVRRVGEKRKSRGAEKEDGEGR